MRIKLLGKFWNLIFGPTGTQAKNGQSLRKEEDGFCTSPQQNNKSIVVRSSLKGERELEVLIHEMLHAVDWHKDETDFVEPVAEDMARVLWRLGYRKTKLD